MHAGRGSPGPEPYAGRAGAVSRNSALRRGVSRERATLSGATTARTGPGLDWRSDLPRLRSAGSTPAPRAARTDFPRILEAGPMRRQRTQMFLLPLLALLALPLGAQAQESSMRGTFVLDRAHSDDVNRAIETAVSRMSFITRPIARGRLRRTNTPYSRLSIDFTPQ